jgi:hypothetical protein
MVADDNIYGDALISATNPLGTSFNEYQDLTADIIPSGMPSSVPVMNNIAGGPQTGPYPESKVQSGGLTMGQSIAQAIKNPNNWILDPNAFGKSYNYTGGLKGQNFERYYNHPKFRELKFSPIRDNETYYNANSTWWDDFVRMGTQWTGLLWSGWKSPYDFGAEDSGKEYQKAMAVGMSSRGGIGGFTTNLALNSAFTIGIVGEMVAENFAIAGLTWATGGLATAPAIGAEVLKTGKTVEMAAQTLNSGSKFVEGLQEVNAANKFWKSANEISTGEKVWNFVNPLSRTQNYITDLYKGTNGFRAMNEFVKTRKAFGAFYRDLREINLVVSESMLEGTMARNDNNDKAIDKFYVENNGRLPTEKEAQQIYEKSMNVGFATSVANIPVIYFTNKLVFDDLFHGFRSPAAVGEEILAGSTRKLTTNKAWKLGDNVYGGLELSLKQKTKDFLLRSPYLPWTKKYLLGNFGEGFQEFSQEVTSDAANAYYDKTYADPSSAGMLGVMSAVGTGLSNQFSMKGLEVFMSGFLMGSVIQGVSSTVFSPMTAPGLYKEYFKSAEFQELKAAKEKTENLVLETANDLLNTELGNFNQTMTNALEAKNYTDKMQQAEAENNQKAYQDAKDEKTLNHLYTLSSAKKMDMVFDFLDGLQTMKDANLVEAFAKKGVTASEIREKINDFRSRAIAFKNTYDAFTERYPNPHNPSSFDKAKSPIAHAQEMINKRAWDMALKDTIMATALYGKNIERMKSVYNTFVNNQSIRGANVNDFSILLDDQALEYEIQVLGDEVELLAMGTPEQKSQAENKAKKLDALKSFRAGKYAYESNMLKMRKISAQNMQRSETIAVGNIFRDKETGELVEVLDISEDGKTIGVRTENNEDYDFPREDLEPVYEDRFTEDAFEEANQKLYDIFKDYVGVVGSITPAGLLNYNAMNDSFVAMRDYMAIKNESNSLFKTVNALNNPEIFLEYSQRFARMEALRMENFTQIIRNSHDKLSKIYMNNILLNALADLKISIDPNDARKVLAKAEYEGVVFYDAFSAEPITPQDERYPKLQEELKKYKEYIDSTKKERAEKKKEEVQVEEEVTSGDIDQQYKEEVRTALLEFIKRENEKREKDGEALLAEDITDPATAKFIEESTFAQNLIKSIRDKYEAMRTKGPEVEEVKPDWTPKNPPKGLEKLAAIYAEVWKITKNEQYYVNKNGTSARRVTYLKQDFEEDNTKTPAGKERGSVMDSVIRAVIEGSIKLEVDEKNNLKDESLKAVRTHINDLIERKGYRVRFEPNAVSQFANAVYRFKSWADSMGLTLYGDVPAVVDTLGDELYGGSIDILAKDKSGKFFIIDLKTNNAKFNRRSESGRKRYMNADMIQLNAYAALVEQKTGVDITGLYVLNMSVEHGGPFDTTAYDKVVNIRLEVDNNVRDTAMDHMLIPIERKDIYELDRTIGKKRLSKKGPKMPVAEYAMRYDLVYRFNMDKGAVDAMNGEDVKAAHAAALAKFVQSGLELTDDVKGKIVYATPGSGKSTLVVDDIRLVDMDKLLIEEMMSRQPQFTKKEKESDQEFIYRYSTTFSDKEDVNRTVANKARMLADAGKTVLTGSLSMIPYADVVVTVPPSNQRVIERFKNKANAGTYTKKEAGYVEQYDKENTNGLIIELEKEELEDVIYAKPGEAPPAEAPVETEVKDKKSKGPGKKAVAREQWYAKMQQMDIDEFNDFLLSMEFILSDMKSTKKYVKENGITVSELMDNIEKMKTEFGLTSPQTPVADPNLDKSKEQASKDASNMSTEMEIMKNISNTKKTEGEAKSNFLDNIC